MNGLPSLGDDYSVSRLPLSAKSSFLSVTLVRVGAITTLAQFMLGATLGHAMTFSQAMLATFLGSLLLQFVSLGLGIAGAREGLSISLLARWCGFGRVGSVIIGSGIAISLLGWFGILNAVFANSLNHMLGDWISFSWAAALSGMALTILVAFGFRALSWTAKLAVPVFFLAIGWISLNLLAGHKIADLVVVVPTGTPITIAAGATMVAGGYIVGALMTPDISRYCKNSRHVFWMTMACILVGEFIVNGVAILIAHALNTDDVVTIMIQTSGWIGLLTVILATIKINDVCLYSSSLALTNVVEGITGNKWSRTWLTVLLGIVGTLLSIVGILDKFTDFLTLLGVIFPPISGVMMVDYYVLRTSRKLLDTSRQTQSLPESTPLIGWKAIAACVVGTIGGMNIELGIPSFNSLIIASTIYWMICIIQKKS
ncbi:cytosine permease [Yersinia pekkanenii]|uniref:Purine and pyrimidine permease n=1 Tax=Yersinia pekkanenii TaxID=1288385 RepID=A0A0T9NHQ0_9GAMM|nr:cytosine permease [Yersinia pekkanenii]CNH10643.1 putative purine and pyrimidine permease [Yersinia pekkanenii]CRY64784.1 putative purine and pyrimidine permease [Yersinia pekkanenii]